MFNINKLKGHNRNRKLLERLYREGSASGAYLFSGMDAIGKKLTALWFSQFINCPEENPPCGNCLSCRKIDKNIHPDIKIISRREDKTVITIDQIREELISEANYKPHEAAYRIFIIDDAHQLNEQSQNALLKVTEEPGDSIIIILVTSRPSELIDTIVSRCRILRFFPLSSSEMESVLSDASDVPEDRIKLVTATSSGSPGKAIRQACDKDFWEMRKKIFGVLEKLPDGSLGDIIKFCDGFKISRREVEKLESFFEILLSWIRDLLYIQEGLEDDTLINRDFGDSMRKVVYCFQAENLMSLEDLILEVRKLVFENNLNIRFGMQRMFIKIKEYGSI
ncbi:MAG: DNA polymerase III subunit [Candidatus Eremiobacteraeota bacterium]|nr:DNA polymerase III subunit [Candidatus Eremiobacteraeota bacterium]